MLSRAFSARRSVTHAASLLLLWVGAGCELLPTPAWQVSGAIAGPFTADGSAVYATTSTGFQLRRAVDGAVLSTINLPSTSRGYDAKAFSRDSQYVALSKREDGVTRIELWSVSSGTLLRTIATDAVRNARGLDLSTNGLVASLERFAYGGGGYLRVYRLSDGTLVHRRGPIVVNGSTLVRFSPNGAHLAFYQNAGISRHRDGGVAVPSGQILQSAPLDLSSITLSAVTPDNRHFLAGQTVSVEPGATAGTALYFLRAADGVAQLTYTFGSERVSAGAISPTGTLFSYAVCPSDANSCTAYIARMPPL
jgi:WD40 repeat protein